MSQASLQVAVIGGGAAGFFSAITCAETYPHVQVTLIEASRQILTKVRISGGGRCNVTHACFDPALLVQNYPRGGKALRGPIERFGPKDTIAWFAQHGVKLKTEADGRMFPTTDDSATIVDCLVGAAKAAGVKICTGTPVASVRLVPSENLNYFIESQAKVTDANLVKPAPLDSKSSTKFEIELKTGEILACDRLLLATGSNPIGYQIAKALGHTIELPVPSLFTFNIKSDRLQDLAGISVDNVRLRLQVASKNQFEQTGSLLITHWGISGPAVLKLSAWGARILHDCNYQAPLLINWLPQYNLETLRQQLLKVKSESPKRQITTSCPVPLPRRLFSQLVTAAGIDSEQQWAQLSNKILERLIQELLEGKYQIQGKGVFKEEFVTCGGVSLKEVDFKTMESRICPGLYFAGEILDIDGVTGGFNFQSAWTTAWIAGRSML